MDNLDHLTQSAREVLRQAQSEAARLHHAEVTPEHIAIALSTHQRAMSLAILRELNVPIPRMQGQLREAVGRGNLAAQRIAPLSRRFERAVELALDEAKVFGAKEIGTQHLLLGVIREGGDAKDVLAGHGVSLYGTHKLMRSIHMRDGEALPAIDLNQTPIMKSAVARAVRSLPIRPSPVFVGILGFTVLMAFAAWLNFPIPQIPVILFVLGGWVISVCLHEFGHAAIAYLGGDTTVVNKGYLTLNPLKYTHRLLSIILPIVFLLLGGIPLPGGAVYIDRSMIRNRKMLSLMSAGGVLMELLLILVMLIPYHLFAAAGFEAHPAFWGGYTFLMYLNIFAIVINLLPIPGIDGFGIISPFLPFRIVEQANKVLPYTFLILFIVLVLPNPIRDGIGLAVRGLASVAGINSVIVGTGSGYFRIF